MSDLHEWRDLWAGPASAFAPELLAGQVAIDPMPWDLDAEIRRCRERDDREPVVAMMQPIPVGPLIRSVQPGGSLIVLAPGTDDASDVLGPLGWGPSPTRGFAATVEAIRAGGFDIADCGQWRSGYHFLGVSALLAFVKMAWWLPAPMGFSIEDRAELLHTLDAGAPLTGTQSRFWVRAHRPRTA